MEHINSTSISSQHGDCDGNLQPPQSRGRNNSTKSKLLRSHAMREEASPPREPTPTSLSPSHLKGPLLTLPSSRGHSPINPCVVVSPSHPTTTIKSSDVSSTTICISPTATLTPPPTTKCSPRNLSPIQQDHYDAEEVVYSKSGNGTVKVNGKRESFHHHERVEKNYGHHDRYHERDIVEEVDHEDDEEAEEREYVRRKNGRLKIECGCGGEVQCCSKCLRNFNNNLSCVNNNGGFGGNTLSVTRAGSRGSLRHQGSSQGSFESNYTSSPRLSRDNSAEIYTDTTGVNLVKFIQETLNKNMKDRQLLLKIEQELLTLCECNEKTHFKFPAMSSYQRMLVHRVAAYFGMDHNIEPSGKSVVVNKTRNTRIPEDRFESYIRDDIGFTEEPRRSILKRDSNSMEDYSFKSPDRQSSYESRRSKSIEEREEEYKRARRRIFNNKEMGEYASSEDMGWHDQSWSSMEGDASSFRLQPPDHHARCGNRLIKVHSEEMRDETLRPHVAKSYSFGGYGGVHSRSDHPHSNGPRLLTKQDSATSSSRLSPSSSGYKTQSQRSGSVTPSPTSISFSGDSLRQDSMASVATNTSEQTSPNGEQQEVVWVQFNVNNAPKGKEIIDPNTGTTARNPDGSIYKFDPDNVPPNVVVLSDNSTGDAESGTKSVSPPKQGARPKECSTPRRKQKKNGSGNSTGSSVSSPITTNSGYIMTGTDLGPAPSYTFPGPPSTQQHPPMVPYNYSYPSNDYMVYNQLPYDNREPVPSQEISYYVSTDQINNGSMSFGSNQPWVQHVYQPVQTRYGTPCVVYGAPPIANSEGMFPPNPAPLYVAQGPPPIPPQPMYPPNIVYGNTMYPPTGYSQPMYPQCAPPTPSMQHQISGPVYCQPDQMNMLSQNFSQLMVTAPSSNPLPRHCPRFNQPHKKTNNSISSPSDSASPATVVSSTYAQVTGNAGLRTPTNTPPVFNYSVPPPMMRPVSGNIRASPASNQVSTRSSTPGDINSDRGRYNLPSTPVLPFPSPVGSHMQPSLAGGRGQNVRPPRQQNYQGDYTIPRGRHNNRRQRRPLASP
nr:cAMP-regulated phosphoprotein 21 isoform X1 [Onthophagus taurus]XP_022901767.1 cAMP-regulated phosphoprotein 21 isoform X1 [Onthophagus taurus]XP_022901768.1 cAMP-regulated phosphoprotein 21 isoform X1 [Onthophagus taurus]